MKHTKRHKAIILLADGTIFHGKSIGKQGSAFGEICFNTGATGYQETITDPSNYGQLMVATNAHLGGYGTVASEVESDAIQIAGLICRNFSYDYSRAAADSSLEEFFDRHKAMTISEVDTRALVNHIRDNGTMNAVVSTQIDRIDQLKKELADMPVMNERELASKVSTKQAYYLGNAQATYRIAVLDLGIKQSMLTNLAQKDVYIKVFPYDTSFEELNTFKPDGFFLSNGPGDPRPLTNVIALTKTIIAQNLPLFGVGLGHQIIGLANGISTYKMPNGHRGINHPVKNLITGKGEITTQNHGFALRREEAEQHPDIEITHVHLNDNTIAGLRMKSKNVFSVQYHPASSPGPNDASYLFDQFIENIKNK